MKISGVFNSGIGGVLAILGFVSSIYVGINTPDFAGTDFYLLIPLAYAIMALICRDVFKYHEGSFGLKCFYIVSFVRYVLLPVYTCSTGTFAIRGHKSPPEAYIYAIIVSVLEVIVAFSVIKAYYPKIYKRQTLKKIKTTQYYNDLGIGGFILILFMIAVVVFRGHLNSIIGTIRFLVVSEQFDMDADFWTYEIWAIQLFFAIITIVSTSYFMKREHRKSSLTNIIVPLICAFFSCTLILTNNRMTMVYYALCGLCILLTAFPKRSKLLSGVMIGSMLLVIVSFTLMKNFGIDATDYGGSQVSEDEGASTISAYVCGVENIAHSYDMFLINGDKVGPMTIVSEVIRFFMLSRLPGMRPEFVNGVPTTVDLATEGTEMVSVAGETLFWGTPYLGWFLDIIAVFIIVRFLVYFDVRTKLEDDLGRKYVYSWLSILFGIFMCYCIQTLWNNVTYIPLLLTGALWVNRNIRIKKTVIRR